jgi:hypothetical protein
LGLYDIYFGHKIRAMLVDFLKGNHFKIATAIIPWLWGIGRHAVLKGHIFKQRAVCTGYIY